MLWEELSTMEFEASIEKSERVCILPMGVLEKHGDHLPLGTDMYIVTETAKKAAEKSPAVVFPYYFLGQIAEARHAKGTLSATHRLIMDSLLEMCDEIYRNGFTKIFILNGHGGNYSFVPFFLQQFPALNRKYAIYTYYVFNLYDDQLEIIKEKTGADASGDHAGFLETSLIMHLRPDLVHMDRVKVSQSESMQRLKSLKDLNVSSGFNWYAEYPHHFAGDPSPATPENGKFIFDYFVNNVANVINAIKTDNVLPSLVKEYNSLVN